MTLVQSYTLINFFILSHYERAKTAWAKVSFLLELFSYGTSMHLSHLFKEWTMVDLF